MTRRGRILAGLWCLVIGGSGLWLAADGESAEAQGGIGLQAQVIHASNEPGGLDNRLGGSLADNLQKTFRYSRYQLLDAPKGSVNLGQTWRTALPGERALEIAPTGVHDGQYSLNVRIVAPGGQAPVNSVVRLKRGATVLVGGPSHQQGVLIIAISLN